MRQCCGQAMAWVTLALLVPTVAVARELVVDTAQPAETIDLTRFALGQGGLADEPMFEDHVDQIARLRPQTIRLFVQEYFDLLPEPGKYHWATLDRSIETILATGAKPILSLCFKPRVLFPEIDQDRTRPTDYAAWQRLIEALVRHCNQEKRYGIEYWEVGNEVDIGESGGCPYRFQPQGYTEYYARTVEAIRRVDPAAKVGGPALAGYQSPIGDALIDFCGHGEAPLDFFSWHLYSDDPHAFRQTIRSIKFKLARFPRLAETETILDEWNIGLVKAEPAVGYQAAFVLETTRGFMEEGLSRAAYYHLRDSFVDPDEFRWMSPGGREFMADWWNVKPQNSGLFDNQGRRRPAYYAFQMLSHLRGKRVPVSGTGEGLEALAAQDGSETHVVVWNFAPPGAGQPREIELRFTRLPEGSFRVVQLNAEANRLDTVRSGASDELETSPLRLSLPPLGIAWVQAGRFPVHASWGHKTPAARPFYLKLRPGTLDLKISASAERPLEPDDSFDDTSYQGSAGGGDVDAVEFSLALPSRQGSLLRKEQSIWTHLLAESDPDTARRLRQDPAFRTDPPLVEFQLNPEATRGFSVSVDQLLEQETLWVPAFDLLLSTGPTPVSVAAHQRALAPATGRRICDQVCEQPEATYAEYAAHWEDMGKPDYQNPHSVPPGHVVGITWDSAIPKFGVDRQAGVISDLGNPEQFRLDLDLAGATWEGQRLTGGLPVLTTTLQQDDVRYEIEQFAFPLHGPPKQRRGDIAMVLFEKVRAKNTGNSPREVTLRLGHRRRLPSRPDARLATIPGPKATLLTETASGRCLLSVEGADAEVELVSAVVSTDEKEQRVEATAELAVGLTLAADASREFVVKLPSPVVSTADHDVLRKLDYAAARTATLEFWSEYLDRGAVFEAPDPAVNELFRANLWHALRLPRRHGSSGENVRIDLPYSNFAYGQLGTPWTVNQAVYVDYMLYDLRGYHDLSREELLAIYRNNQEANGRVGGFANWGVYTPSMLYACAQHYLLSRDRDSFQKLLPATLRAADWCLAEQTVGPARGLVLAPLNDLSHDPRAWAFNQAYFYAGLERLGRALEEIEHPRAAEMRTAAERLHGAIEAAFGRASVRAPLVELRDRTWSLYVPSDALTPRRLLEVWYPTDVDTGALHLARLGALDPRGELATALLNDHEDNLFLHGWGMANEPVYNQQATAYLLRDEPEATIRAFYSMMACAFSHSVFEPVEHRWGWGQYFGPPSTDGAWFELYRRMLIDERADGTLLIGQAVPRAWMADGRRVRVQRAPSYFGPLSVVLESHAAEGLLKATVELGGIERPVALLVRLRHPTGERLKSVEVNGEGSREFDRDKEWVRIAPVAQQHYEISAHYEPDH